MQTERHAPYGAHEAPEGILSQEFDDDEPSLEVERWACNDAAARAELVREERVLDPDRNQFANPIKPAMLARIMGAWVSASLAAVA